MLKGPVKVLWSNLQLSLHVSVHHDSNRSVLFVASNLSSVCCPGVKQLQLLYCVHDLLVPRKNGFVWAGHKANECWSKKADVILTYYICNGAVCYDRTSMVARSNAASSASRCRDLGGGNFVVDCPKYIQHAIYFDGERGNRCVSATSPTAARPRPSPRVTGGSHTHVHTSRRMCSDARPLQTKSSCVTVLRTYARAASPPAVLRGQLSWRVQQLPGATWLLMPRTLSHRALHTHRKQRSCVCSFATQRPVNVDA